MRGTFRSVTALGLATALLSTAGWAAPADDAMQADRDFAKMAQDKGVAEAFAAYAAPNALRFVPGGPQKGPAVIKESVAKDFADGGKLNWEPKEGMPSADGSVVVVWGRWTYTSKDGTGTGPQGTYLTVWAKQADGSWKYTHDIGNADPRPKP
jgi:ketosteroid isomerase-like protein